MKNKCYSKKYSNISKWEFFQTNLINKACIIFIPEDGYHNKPNQYPEGYIPYIKKHAESATDVLYLPIEDVNLNSKCANKPTLDYLLKIDTFLQKNKNIEIISVCDAGISRSGFITFYLDLKNNNLKNVKILNDNNERSFETNNRPRKNSYMTNSGFTELLMNSTLLTKTERKNLKWISDEKTIVSSTSNQHSSIINLEF